MTKETTIAMISNFLASIICTWIAYVAMKNLFHYIMNPFEVYVIYLAYQFIGRQK